MLRRYWFQFSEKIPYDPLNMGCGITARDLNDAEKILNEVVFVKAQRRTVSSVMHDVDISTLDNNHVGPNMGNPAVIGVWFPLGYS